ncbi:hypothetical protein ACOSP7_019665 [Xanthoceras sorbifolium]
MEREKSSNLSISLLFSLLILLFVTEIQARKLQQVVCSSSCGDIKNISYPFRLKSDPVGCGDPNYELSCESNKTILEFHSGKYYVKKISYSEQIIRIVDVNLANGSCGLPYKSLSVEEILHDRRYKVETDHSRGLASFIRCSTNLTDRAYLEVPCRSGNQSHVYVISGSYSIANLPDSCFFLSMVPTIKQLLGISSYATIQPLLELGFDLGWSVECRDCIAAGASDCLPTSDQKPYNYNCSKSGKYLYLQTLNYLSLVSIISRFIAGPIILIVLLNHKCRTRRKTVDKVDIFLHKQQSWMPKRYSYTEITAITNHFKDKLGQGGFGSVYKGQLHNGCLIAVKVLENSKFSREEFINEVSTISRIHHANGSKRALVYEYMPNGSLDRHIFSKKGTARGIKYLHEGCDVCILHFDIKPHNILLDFNFIPKVADFGLAKFYPKENDFICVSATRGTIGYIAPELISRNFGAVSCKSDIYSFGMLLLEMVGGRRNSFAKVTRSSKAYFPSWVHNQITKGGDLELQNVSEIEFVIARKLCIIGLWCIQVKVTDCPSITKVVEMLEGNIDDLQMPPKPCFSSSSQQSSIKEIQSDSSTELLESESIEECSRNNNNDV